MVLRRCRFVFDELGALGRSRITIGRLIQHRVPARDRSEDDGEVQEFHVTSAEISRR
ncbi:MAG: hypothetical protein M5U09_29400 [Gammaproteobacteria bacterium]|nr:hypothetical protein [Gammaproteobacteria bacterium]